MDYFNISPRLGRAVKVICSLLGFIHIAGCMMWLVKVLIEDEETVLSFLDQQSWLNDEHVPLSTTKGKLDAYVVCVYFVTVVTTTVGFGDITPQSSEERIACIVLMILGAFVWGTLLAQVGEIHRAATSRDQEKLLRVSAAVDFLNENEVPRVLRQQIVNWERFYMEHGTSHLQTKNMIHRLPNTLQGDLVTHLYSDIISKVPVFEFLAQVTDCNSGQDQDVGSSFLSTLWMKLEYKTYEASATIVNFGHSADRLLMIVSGKVLADFDTDGNDQPRKCMQLGVGDYLGDFAIMGDTNWGHSSILNADDDTDVRIKVLPYEFVVALELTATDFDECVGRSSILVQSSVERYRNMYAQERIERQDNSEKSKTGLVTFMHVALKWGNLVAKLIKIVHGQSSDKVSQNLSRLSEVIKTKSFKDKSSTLIPRFVTSGDPKPGSDSESDSRSHKKAPNVEAQLHSQHSLASNKYESSPATSTSTSTSQSYVRAGHSQKPATGPGGARKNNAGGGNQGQAHLPHACVDASGIHALPAAHTSDSSSLDSLASEHFCQTVTTIPGISSSACIYLHVCVQMCVCALYW